MNRVREESQGYRGLTQCTPSRVEGVLTREWKSFKVTHRSLLNIGSILVNRVIPELWRWYHEKKEFEFATGDEAEH